MGKIALDGFWTKLVKLQTRQRRARGLHRGGCWWRSPWLPLAHTDKDPSPSRQAALHCNMGLGEEDPANPFFLRVHSARDGGRLDGMDSLNGKRILVGWKRILRTRTVPLAILLVEISIIQWCAYDLNTTSVSWGSVWRWQPWLLLG
jgi:hypothetical protein